jgi:hypothetical protein
VNDARGGLIRHFFGNKMTLGHGAPVDASLTQSEKEYFEEFFNGSTNE